MSENENFQLATFSVVVVGSNHNPTLLNPDFLRINKIVPIDQEVTKTITTPPVAIVEYKSGLSITVEMEKLQVLQAVLGKLESSISIVPDVAMSYIRTLPHVPYTAVGINWIGHVLVKNPETWVRDRFITDGPWKGKELALAGAGVRLIYPLNGGVRCNLSLEPGQSKVKEDAGPEPVLIVNANYHHDIPKDLDIEGICAIIAKWQEREKHFKKLITTVLDAEV